MKYLPLVFALLVAPAAAQGIPPGATELATDGLGDGGHAFQWIWREGATVYDPATVQVFLQTGVEPEPYGRVTVNLDPNLYPTGRRPLCNSNMAWTGPEYTAPGYTNPEPLGIVTSQGHYDTAAQLVDIWWSTGNFLPPYVAYSIIVTCVSKDR